MSLLFSLFLLSVSSIAFADGVGASSGLFMVVKGDIRVVSKAGKNEVAKIGSKVTEGDTVISGHDSRAKIVMADKNVLNISPDSKVTIEKYQNNPNGKDVELKVEFGKVRASVEQKYDGDKSKFNIRTPTAVAGVRGTDFITGFNTQTHVSQIITFSGMVAVGKPGPGGAISNPVYVSPGHMTQIMEGKPPEAPKAVPSSELKQMNQETKTEAKQTPPATAAPTATASNTTSDSGKATSPANPPMTPPATPPSMIDSQDVGANLGSTVNVRGPASAATPPPPMVMIPPPVVQPTVPQSSFVNGAIQNNQKSHTSISIVPQ